MLYSNTSRLMIESMVCSHIIPDDNFALGENYIEETMIWFSEKLTGPDARIAHT